MNRIRRILTWRRPAHKPGAAEAVSAGAADELLHLSQELERGSRLMRRLLGVAVATDKTGDRLDRLTLRVERLEQRLGRLDELVESEAKTRDIAAGRAFLAKHRVADPKPAPRLRVPWGMERPFGL